MRSSRPSSQDWSTKNIHERIIFKPKLLTTLGDGLTSPTRSIFPAASPIARGSPLPPELSTLDRRSLSLLLLLLALLVVVAVLAVLLMVLPLSPAARDAVSCCCCVIGGRKGHPACHAAAALSPLLLAPLLVGPVSVEVINKP